MTSDLKEALNSLKIERDVPRGSSGGGRRALFLVISIAVVGLLAWWMWRPRPIPVRTAVVAEAPGSAGGPAAVLNASGYLTARREATVSSKVTGKVVEVHVEEGMRVEKDQILAKLDDTQANLALNLAESQRDAAQKDLEETEVRLAQAKIDLARSQELKAQGIAAQSDLDQRGADAKAFAAHLESLRKEVEVAARNVAVARQGVEDTVIRAPFAGIAISKNAQPGEMISPLSAGGGFTRTGISTVVDMSSIEIEVDVNEAYIERVRPGQKVEARLNAYPDTPIPAHVITTIPAADRDKATVKVRIAFERLDSRMLPDMGVKVAFLGESGEGGAAAKRPVVVPRAAVRGERGQEYVFVVAGGVVERRAVRLAAGNDDPAQVLAGVAAGERIVVEGPADLGAGAKVRERENP